MTSEEHDLYIEAIGKLPKAKQNEIANVCYANVVGRFADFCNPVNRYPNFKWSNFVDNCIKDSEWWMRVHHVTGNEKYVSALARQYAKEIATLMVDRSGFIENESNKGSLIESKKNET